MSKKNNTSTVSTPARILALALAVLVTSTTLVFLVEFIMSIFAK